MEKDRTQRPRGFAAMGTEQQRKIASAGDQAAHRKGKAHKFTEAEAREAGDKGHASRLAKQQASNAPMRHSGTLDDEVNERESDLQVSYAT